MKKLFYFAIGLCFVTSCLFIFSSCNGALKSITGRQLDNKEDIEYALGLIKERIEKKKVIKAQIDGSGRELRNSIEYVRIYDLSDNNEVAIEMIGVGTSTISSYEPSSVHNSSIQAKRRDPAKTPAIDPAILDAELLMQSLEKAKAILAKEYPDYAFKVVGDYDFEVKKEKTICELTLHVTKASDSQYSSNYYYEVKFKFDKDGNIELIDWEANQEAASKSFSHELHKFTLIVLSW